MSEEGEGSKGFFCQRNTSAKFMAKRCNRCSPLEQQEQTGH